MKNFSIKTYKEAFSRLLKFWLCKQSLLWPNLKSFWYGEQSATYEDY